MTREEMYDKLYEEADVLIKKEGICHIFNGECDRYKVNMYGYKAGEVCCGKCKYLALKGCTVKSLACKLWICSYISNTHSNLAEKLERLSKKASDNNIPYMVRASKEDVFGSKV